MRQGTRKRITSQARRAVANPVDIRQMQSEHLFVYRRDDGKWSVCRRLALARFGVHWRRNRLDPHPFDTQREAFAYALRLTMEQP